VSKVDKVLQVIGSLFDSLNSLFNKPYPETGVAGAMAEQAQASMVVTGITMGLEAVGGMEAIEQGLNTFMDAMPGLFTALDAVAQLHPFVGVAVMAFKAVWALEMKRRENDRRILALHMEMKDMMAVLTQ
jgi:hypothetical protein